MCMEDGVATLRIVSLACAMWHEFCKSGGCELLTAPHRRVGVPGGKDAVKPVIRRLMAGRMGDAPGTASLPSWGSKKSLCTLTTTRAEA